MSSSSWSVLALGVAGLALVLAIASWAFFVKAIRRERDRRVQRINEAVFNWAGNVATKAELADLRQAVTELSDLKESMRDSDLRRAVSELSGRVTSLEAEATSMAEEQHGTRFFRLPRR